jgi:hypothetical protein
MGYIPRDILIVIVQQAHLLWLSENFKHCNSSHSNEFLYGRMNGGHISYAMLERSITLQRAFTEGSDSSFKECYEFISNLW